MRAPTLSGYTAWTAGLSIWPREKITRLWADLQSIRTRFSSDRHTLESVLTFRTGRPLRLVGAQVFSLGTGPGRYAEMLALAVSGAPAGIEVDELTREVVRWGPRSVRRESLGPVGQIPSVADLLHRARHHRVWLEPGKALKAVRAALLLEPGHREAERLNFRLLVERGASKDRLRVAAERWVAAAPHDADAQAGLLGVRLAQADGFAESEAVAMLGREPNQAGLAADLGAFRFRRGDYAGAAAIWKTLATTTVDPLVRTDAESAAIYAGKMADRRSFRVMETLKRRGTVALFWVLVGLTFGLQFFRLSHWLTGEAREGGGEERTARMETERQETWRKELQRLEAEAIARTGMIVGDYATVRKRAEAGEGAAQYTLAVWLAQGSNGAPLDPGLAQKYLEQAVDQNHRAAVLALAEQLEEGARLPRDAPRAVQLYERAARLGSPRAARLLGEHYRDGIGVAEDKAEAFMWFEQAGTRGDARGRALAGWAREKGEGVPADQTRALDDFRQAATQNDRWAQEHLFWLLTKDGGGLAHLDEAMAVMWAGAANGSFHLQLIAGEFLLLGQPMADAQAANTVEWLRQGALAGRPGAATLLGRMAAAGIGRPQDFAQAIEWWEQDAAQEEDRAWFHLARHHAFGVGTARSSARAAEARASITGTPPWLEELDRALRAAAEPIDHEEADAADSDPKLRYSENPVYPLALSDAGVTGEVTVSFRLNADGFTRDVEVVAATHPAFGTAARLAVSFWRYSPGRRSGRPYYGPVVVPVVFSLSTE